MQPRKLTFSVAIEEKTKRMPKVESTNTGARSKRVPEVNSNQIEYLNFGRHISIRTSNRSKREALRLNVPLV
jgi:hypothetical protein